MSATRAVIDFVLGTSLDDLSADVLSEGRRCVTDGIGVMLAGSTDHCAHIVRDEIAAVGETHGASILGTSQRAAPALAARANGTAGHAMDYDDTQLSNASDRIFGLLTHPTVAPLSAGLAVAEHYGKSGAEFLEAFLIGFEVECKMAEAINPRHYGEGFHSTATFGTYAAAVTAAKMKGLDETQLEMALGIAGSMASGIRLGFGTMTKPLHAGRAAENGITAVELASRGFTSGLEPLEGMWGFFRVFGGGFEEDRLVGTLGAPYSIVDPGVSVKPYPSGSLGHPSMDAMLALVTDNDITADQIESVTFRAGNNILKPLRYRRPRNELEAKFCIPFILSSIALRRRAGIAEFTDEYVLSAEVAAMMDRVEVTFDEEIDAMGYDRMRSAIDVSLNDGREFSTTADTYRGGPERPLTRHELHGKFRECAELVLDDAAIDDVLDRLDRIETLGSIDELVAGLTPASA